MGSMEGGGAPLLNDYKLEFFWKRFPQTLLGGPKLKLGYEAPFYVYLNQLLIYLTPFVLGGVFTIFAEFDIITDAYVNSYIYGGLMIIFVLSTQLFTWLMRRRSSNLAKFQKNLLAQDDEIDFVSCCGFETLEFLFPGKKFVVNMVLHGLISGVLCALMFLYLLPSTLNGLYSNTGATVIVFILGWWVVCIAQYSLTSKPPTELAIFRALDSLEVTPLMRPFYVLLFGIIGVLARNYPELVSVDKALHILFAFLPLLWTLGILPPLDALFSWLAEQVLVLVLGGSPMATDLRLLVIFVFSSLVVVMTTFITSNTANIMISACFGFILSVDIFGFALQVQDKLSSIDTKDPASCWKLKEVIIFAVMLSLTAVVAGVSCHFSSSGSLQIFESFGFVFLVLWVLVKILGDIQRVSIFFGLFRNPLYPASIDSSGEFKKRKKALKYVGLVRQGLLVYVSPLLQVAFLSMFLLPGQPSISNFVLAVGTVRALRQVWQNTFHSLLEVSVVCLSVTAFGSDVAAWWASAGLGLQLMLVGACRNRLQPLFERLVFMMTLAVTSWKLPKQRHKSTVPILVTCAFLFPVVIAVLGMATVLAAPLLPVFCLPIFLIGFPRPLRSWSSAASTAAASCPDSVYYKQLMPQVVSNLGVTVSLGALGNPDPGDHFLVRFQDRLIWVHVLESGYKFCTIVLKGLELQETSCHTVEATRVDDVFQDIFVHEGKWPLVSLNSHVSNVLRPCDSLVINTYSDAKNVLTGVIDQPENLRRNSENFLKALVWVLVKYCKEHEFGNNDSSARHVPVSIPEEETVVNVPVDDSPVFRPKEVVLDRLLSQDDIELHNLPKTSQQEKDQSTGVATAKLHRSGSLPSLSDSVWSQESLKLDDSFTNPGKQMPHSQYPGSDEGVDDLEDSLNLGGFPALDIGRPKASTTQKTNRNPPERFNAVSSDLQYIAGNSAVFSNNAGASSSIQAAAFTSEHAYKLDMPSNWKFSIPVDKHHIDSLSSKFPDFWLRHVIKSQNFGNDNETVAQSIINDPALIGIYKQLTCACYAVVEVLGFPGSSATAAGPGHVHKVYSGNIPWSMNLDWLEKDTQLKSLVLKAYRYAFKLTYDEAVLGEVTNEDELVEYLTEYDRDWYLGSETDRDWQTSIMADKPFLFSLGRDKSQGTYTSHVLTKQEIIAPVGRLNGECVRGQWASLALELLYLTNDDEERYSIQAHPTLLRNLTIQAADPPLGYPVYSSGAVSAPLVVAPL